MSALPDKSRFASLYAGQAPWDIGQPQKPFIDVADQIAGTILDAGCGTGETALFFASRGQKVTGIDFLDEPIQRAKRKAGDRSLSVTFLVKDALTLQDWSERFDNVIDSGLFHGLSDEDRKQYVAGLATVLKAGGRLFLLCVSDEEPGTQGPRRISRMELRDAFSQGWAIESIKPVRGEVVPNLKTLPFPRVGQRRGLLWCGGRDEIEAEHGFLAAGPRASLLRQGRHRRPHAAEERRGSGRGLSQMHRHVLPRWGVADCPGGRAGAAGVAGE